MQQHDTYSELSGYLIVATVIELTDFRKSLGGLGEKLTDEQLQQLRDMECKLADAVFDQWLHKRNQVKTAGLLPPVRHNVGEETL